MMENEAMENLAVEVLRCAPGANRRYRARVRRRVLRAIALVALLVAMLP
jgi:hypothetical protein